MEGERRKRKSENSNRRNRRRVKEEEREREKMVAISLYRGNMHRVPPDVPRRWLMPKPQISLKDFRTLLLRRSKALSLLPSAASSSAVAAATVIAKPAPISPPPRKEPQEEGAVAENPNSVPEGLMVEIKVEDGANCDVDTPPVLDQVAALINGDATQVAEKPLEKDDDKAAAVENPASEVGKKQDPIDEEKEKRKREVEEKLQILNEKKHNLVKALKQILTAEEELKRRSNLQAGRPPLPLQADASNDSGSMTRHATPRAGSEANVIVDMEGGEGDDALNPNPQGRQLLRVNSTSPSAESALRRPPYFQHNVGSHPSRTAVVVTGSPSRFAPSGNQGHPSNLPTVSVTGTNYVGSSPSPAASGGTSAFRDARHPSPWN
uniref:Uncharacterized protein n=1 Tax=Opuntia streptacantha TaxID=393608 RepID=A0A7C9AMC1_OPUST